MSVLCAHLATLHQGTSLPDMANYIYHLAEEDRWKAAGAEGYLPAKYEADGFIHATKEPHLVLLIANRFQSGASGNFVCLRIDTTILKSEVKFEAAGSLRFTAAQLNPSGDETAGQEGQQPPPSPQQPLFPHIFGPIDSAAVVAELAVTRSDDGKFVSIEGLC